MRLPAAIKRRETIILVLLATAVLAAVTYGFVTYQTPYGCDSNGVAHGPGIDLQVLAKPCIYTYFTGIVGGSTFLILLIPVSEKKPIPLHGQKLYQMANSDQCPFGQMRAGLNSFYGGAGRI